MFERFLFREKCVTQAKARGREDKTFQKFVFQDEKWKQIDLQMFISEQEEDFFSQLFHRKTIGNGCISITF